MKTLSQNTTSSACAPETGLQQLVATIVPDEQRISFWPQHFGLIPQWVTLEPRVFGFLALLCIYIYAFLPRKVRPDSDIRCLQALFEIGRAHV